MFERIQSQIDLKVNALKFLNLLKFNEGGGEGCSGKVALRSDSKRVAASDKFEELSLGLCLNVALTR